MKPTDLLKRYLPAVLFCILFPSTSCQYYDLPDYSPVGYLDFDVDPRIVNGFPAVPGEAFYQLALFVDNEFLCGATLVQSPTPPHEQFVLTAAHCICQRKTNTPLLPEQIAFLGEAITLSGSVGQIRLATKVIPYEAYTNILQDDIAIVLLDRPFTVTELLRPISLPASSSADVGMTEVTVSGWGNLAEDGDTSDALQIIELPLIKNYLCKKWYGDLHNSPYVLKTTFCAGYQVGGKDSCQGDSGGPAVAHNSDGLFLAGVVSWGKGCARAKLPGVYTKVSQYLDWITEKTEHIGK